MKHIYNIQNISDYHIGPQFSYIKSGEHLHRYEFCGYGKRLGCSKAQLNCVRN